MARNLLGHYQSIRSLGQASPDHIRDVAGLEAFEVLRCLSLIELGRRIGGAGKGPVASIESSEDVAELLDHLRMEKREHFVCILLDSKNGVMRQVSFHIGTLTASLVGPREVFREAIRDGASAIIVAHNHPSGDPSPSPEDIDVTRKLVQVGKMLDIPVLDHVIIGERRHVSLQEKGFI